MPKKILCCCQKGYHYSQSSRLSCRNANGVIKPTSNIIIQHQQLLEGCQSQNQVVLPFANSQQKLENLLGSPQQIQSAILPLQQSFKTPNKNFEPNLYQTQTAKKIQKNIQLQKENEEIQVEVLEDILFKNKPNKLPKCHRNRRERQIRRLRKLRENNQKEKKNKIKKGKYYSCGVIVHKHYTLKYAKRCRGRRYRGYNVEQVKKSLEIQVIASEIQLPKQIPCYQSLQICQSEKIYFQKLANLKLKNEKFKQTDQVLKSLKKMLLGKNQLEDFSIYSLNNDLFSSFSIRQTMLGDCFLMAVCMSMINLDTAHLKKLFLFTEKNQPGYYVIKLFSQGKLVYKQIDPLTFVRIQKGQKMSYIGYAQGALWYTLLGKALMQITGSRKYNNIFPQQVIRIMFGKEAQVHTIQAIQDIIELFNTRKNHIFVITSKQKTKNPWIPQTHSFPIVKVQDKKIGIKNTWGYFRNIKSQQQKQNYMWIQQTDLEDFDFVYHIDL